MIERFNQRVKILEYDNDIILSIEIISLFLYEVTIYQFYSNINITIE